MAQKRQQPDTARQRAIARRRKRRRRSITIILLVVLLIGAGVAINLIFFRVSEIKVENSITSIYTGQEIIEASGIEKGQNIFIFNKSEVSLKLLKELPYIGKVTITRKLPNTVVIKVSETTDYVGIPYRGGYLIVSSEMKVLSDSYTQPVEIPMIYGLTPTSFTPGETLTAEREQTIESLQLLIGQINAYGWFDSVTAINVRDKLDLSLIFENRIFVRIGSPSKIDYKFEFFNKILRENLSDEYIGNIDVSTAGMVREVAGEMRIPAGYFDIGTGDGLSEEEDSQS